MKLSNYMELAGLLDHDFAEIVGGDRSVVSRWRRGLAKPRWDAIAVIAEATKGAVTAEDWMPPAKAASPQGTGHQPDLQEIA